MEPVNVNNIIRKLFDQNYQNRVAITFDEITFEDKPSEIHPNDVDTSSFITKNIKLKSAGILSAAMDTVTEKELALAMAKMGGIGIIHRNMSLEEQANSIKWVRNKIHFGGIIDNPITFYDNQRLSDIEMSIKKNGWTFTNFPILNEQKQLVGMVSRNEMKFNYDGNPLLKEIMLELNKLAIYDKIDDNEGAYNLMKSHKITKLPVVNKDGKFMGLYAWNDIKRDEYKKNLFSLDDEGHFLVGAAVGIGEHECNRVDMLAKAGCKLIVIDTSHGACRPVIDMLDYIKEKYSSIEVIVGNIASYDSALYLLKAGKYKPDGIKCGISVGSICTTRRVTAHGMPQLTAIYQVWKALYDNGCTNIPIIADGGIKYSGDVVKALAVGASAVMIGNVFAGTDESPGKVVVNDGYKFKMVRGMGSRSAMEEKLGSRDRYFNHSDNKTIDNLSNVQKIKVVPEGIEGLTKYRGSIETVILELVGGIRAGLAHSGAANITEFRHNASIWVQSVAGISEANPHSLYKILDS